MSYARVSSYYDHISDSYDGSRFRDRYRQSVASREESFVCARLGSNQKKVLEVGPGTGRFTCHLAKVAGSLTVCDISQRMLDKVRARLGDESQVSFYLKGIESIDTLPDFGQFDAVVALRIVPHVPEWRDALHKLCQAVRPGGLVIFDLWNRQSFVGAARKILRRPSEVLTHRLTRKEIKLAVRSLPVTVQKTLRWGYPRIGNFHLDQVGAKLCPSFAYSTLWCCRRH